MVAKVGFFLRLPAYRGEFRVINKSKLDLWLVSLAPLRPSNIAIANEAVNKHSFHALFQRLYLNVRLLPVHFYPIKDSYSVLYQTLKVCTIYLESRWVYFEIYHKFAHLYLQKKRQWINGGITKEVQQVLSLMYTAMVVVVYQSVMFLMPLCSVSEP